MMDKAMERAERLARERQDEVLGAVADALREAVPDGAVAVDGDEVTVTGRRLLKQWLDSANLRFITDAAR